MADDEKGLLDEPFAVPEIFADSFAEHRIEGETFRFTAVTKQPAGPVAAARLVMPVATARVLIKQIQENLDPPKRDGGKRGKDH